MTDKESLLNSLVTQVEYLSHCCSSPLALPRCHSHVEAVLKTAFEIGRTRTEIPVEYRKKKVGPLLQVSLPAFKIFLESAAGITSDNVTNSRLLRSGLEFILTDFKEFPASAHEDRKATLEGEFIPVIRTEVACWDNSLRNYKPDPQNLIQNPNPDAVNVPASHWWYQ